MTDLTDLSALEISDQLHRKQITSVQVVTAFLDRIDRINPTINAIVSMRPRADILAAAQTCDDTPRLGWLHGMPIAIKDLAETKGIRTTFGSPMMADFIPDQDAEFVRRLKAAGAIVIGKTNTPEFGLGSHTFNPVHGATRNPYDTTKSAGGSSGGATAALAARLVPIADGSDMMGSLRNPAAFCNVYGFRPTWGLVPNDPVGDMYLQELSTTGPMGRSPHDIAALLGTISGPDKRLPFAVTPDPQITNLSASVAGKKIAWLGDWGGAYPIEDGIMPLCENALDVFKGLGCEVTAVPAPFDPSALWQAWVTLRSWACANKMGPAYADPEKRALLKPAMIWEIETGQNLSLEQVYKASETRSAWYRAFMELCEDYDACVLPSAQVWPFPVDWVHPETIGDTAMDTYHRWMEIVVPASIIGVPTLAIPAGFGPTGLPMGIQIFGPQNADRNILTLGAAYHGVKNWTTVAP